ncbi:hypothetical protein PHLGIDRAFT_13121 [Phlebiopsis gigantea 11061_1 CR5-6]|uniref:Glycoside hydrolase family 16 protein n=1 Tax=Phlebiopsis gigantea (strain 11061_1 CR5-6) TaxID=745531 RepID=A0A0C3SB37_PHLG1|nr:hypothetical protein PHLGIDRAFT_13121 [Phlebiopsis gigantea 11061_1 CR5-6]
MQLQPRFLLLVAILSFACTLGLALSIEVAVGSTSSASVDMHAPVSAKFGYNEAATDIMAPHDVELANKRGTGKQLLLGVLATNAHITQAPCSSENPLTCAIGCIFSAFTFFFAAYVFQSGHDEASGRLMTELEPGKWHNVGHVQHQGLNHTVECFNSGIYHQLRARTVPFANAAINVRTDSANDGGFVSDYYWQYNNEGPYDSFHSSSFFAANAGGWMLDSA